jgi:hypothetical protein
MTAGGNLIKYLFELTTYTVDIATSEVMWNSIISTRGARYTCADAGNVYLATPLDCPEYTRIPIKLVPQEFIDANSLAPQNEVWLHLYEHVT